MKQIKSRLNLHLKCAILASLFCGQPGIAGEAGAGAEAELAKWLEIKVIISRESADWKTAKQGLQDRIELLTSELRDLQQKTQAANEDAAKSFEELNKLDVEKRELVEGSSNLVAFISARESALKSLLAVLPEPVRERVRPLSQRLPVDPAISKANLGERYQNVVGILNELTKFGREITLASEVRSLENGDQVEVTAMYIGFGQAYYVNPERKIAGTGRPGVNGWVWESRDDLVAPVQRAIAVYRNEAPAAYNLLPLQVSNEGSAGGRP